MNRRVYNMIAGVSAAICGKRWRFDPYLLRHGSYRGYFAVYGLRQTESLLQTGQLRKEV